MIQAHLFNTLWSGQSPLGKWQTGTKGLYIRTNESQGPECRTQCGLGAGEWLTWDTVFLVKQCIYKATRLICFHVLTWSPPHPPRPQHLHLGPGYFNNSESYRVQQSAWASRRGVWRFQWDSRYLPLWGPSQMPGSTAGLWSLRNFPEVFPEIPAHPFIKMGIFL